MTQDQAPDSPAPSSPESTAAPVASTDAPAAALPPPNPKTPSPAIKGFLAGLAGGVVVTAVSGLAVIAAWPSLHDELLSPEERRLAVLEHAIDDLNPRLSAVERQLARTPGDETALSVQGLAQRLSAVEAQMHAPSADPRVAPLTEQASRLTADVTRLNGEVDSLRRAIPPEGTILRLADRAEAAEKEVREIASQHQSAQALLLVVGQLRDATDRGDPYEVELRAARRVAPPEDAQALDALTASAATGVPRKDALIAAFPALANRIVNAAVAPADGNFWQRTLNKAVSLISVRRIDGTGNDTTAVVARAEARVKDGDLAKAAEELGTLQGEPAEAAAAWIKSANARIAVDRALSELAATTAAQTAKSGG